MILRTIDKLDKIGLENVKKELMEQDLDNNSINGILEFINIKGSNGEVINKLKDLKVNNEIFQEGLKELETVVQYIGIFGVTEENYRIDLTIARGLDYYTGTVYETFLDDHPEIGSICSGGRYDDLATHYTKQKLPGVGISIGLTRLFYQLREANIIQATDSSLTTVLIIPMKGYMDKGIEVGNALRKNDIYTQIYVESGKMGKKFNYADKLNIPYVIIIGEEEVKNNAYSFRDMKTGEQESLPIEDIINRLK